MSKVMYQKQLEKQFRNKITYFNDGVPIAFAIPTWLDWLWKQLMCIWVVCAYVQLIGMDAPQFIYGQF